MITATKENYLKAILEAEVEHSKVLSIDLARWLGVSPPAVTMALRRLTKDGLVCVRDHKVELTAHGRAAAKRVAVRHHLIERMLFEVFGMEWSRVHEEAERLEHAISPDFELRLHQKLGVERPCPHGNMALPESSRLRRKRGLLLLSEAEPESLCSVNAVCERDSRLLEFLDRVGIRPGVTLKVQSKEYDQTIGVKGPRGTFTLGGYVTDKIWVMVPPATQTNGWQSSIKHQQGQ